MEETRSTITKALVALAVALGVSVSFLLAHERTIQLEGGYSNHADDLGGATRWGITEAVARRWGYEGEMVALPDSTALRIAEVWYWQALRLDEVDALYSELAWVLYDVGFNTGTSRAGVWLQRCLNVNNAQGTRYADVAVDGVVGDGTLRALRRYADLRGGRGEAVLITCVRGLQVAHYVSISEARPPNESFAYGWLRRADR